MQLNLLLEKLPEITANVEQDEDQVYQMFLNYNYFVTSVLFYSLLKPMAVISLIPILYVCVFLTFYLFGFNFDQEGFASFILLSGLVVNSAIYIINDFK